MFKYEWYNLPNSIYCWAYRMNDGCRYSLYADSRYGYWSVTIYHNGEKSLLSENHYGGKNAAELFLNNYLAGLN